MATVPKNRSQASLNLGWQLRLHNIEIVDTFAEAFPMTACRVIVTAINPRWAEIAAVAAKTPQLGRR